MENYKIIAQWSNDRFEELFYQIRKAINEIHKQRLSEDGIRINIPYYASKLIQEYNNRMGASYFEYEEGKTTMFGCIVYPSFENLVVVFHVDMPIYGNTSYQVIDLKKV